MTNDMKFYYEGRKLYGDDFPPNEIERWYADEQEGYANLIAKDHTHYTYSYHRLNQEYGFRFLPEGVIEHALGFGSAYGHEFIPILTRIRKLTILEPSDAFVTSELSKVPIEYVKPRVDGHIPFPDDQFDLICCLSVLHHIPNVTAVLRELARCLAPGGYLLLREPIVSMGDWRQPRKGLTSRERGIPLHLLHTMIDRAGLQVIHEQYCMFSLTSRLRYLLSPPVYNTRIALVFDRICCQLFAWNTKYHATHWFDKLRPTCVYCVITK